MGLSGQNIITSRFVQCMQSLLATQKVLSARKLAQTLDYKPQGMSEILNGKRNVPLELLHKAVDQYKLNLRFLFSGEGEMFETNADVSTGNTRVIVTDKLQKERIVHVPAVAYAGYQDNLAEPIFMQDLQTYSLPENILRAGSYRSFDVAGESMEPTLVAGDKVIGAIVEPQYWEQGIKDNMIHVLVTHHEVVVKRVMNYIKTEKMLELRSDNTVVAPYHLPIADLKEAWVVRLRITANLNAPKEDVILKEMRNSFASLVSLVTST